MPKSCSVRPTSKAWVGHYFDYMDQHGAFVLASAHSAPDDDAFRVSRNRMVSRASWKLGQAIAGKRRAFTGRHRCRGDGLARSAWHTVQRQTVAVGRDEMVVVVAEMICAMASPGK